MSLHFITQLTRVKMQNEERIKGMLPSSLRQDMEDTILCLRSQVRNKSEFYLKFAIKQSFSEDHVRLKSLLLPLAS